MKIPGEFHVVRWSGWNCVVSVKVEIDMNRTYSKVFMGCGTVKYGFRKIIK